jgi:hypothetical protein
MISFFEAGILKIRNLQTAKECKIIDFITHDKNQITIYLEDSDNITRALTFKIEDVERINNKTYVIDDYVIQKS